MNKTLFDGCNTEEQKHEFDRQWTSANRDNLYVTIKPCSEDTSIIRAFDKKTDKEMAFFRVNNNELDSFEYMQKDFEPYPFDIKIVGKPGDTIYFVIPEFGDRGNFDLKLRKENIRSGIIKRVNGANDTVINVTYKDKNEGTASIMRQTLFFVDKQSAEEACELTPKDGWENWESYEKAVADLLEYRYKINVPIKYGEAYKRHDLNKEQHEKALRVVFECNEDSAEATVQLSPVIKSVDGKREYRDITAEVMIKRTNGYTQHLYTTYNNEEVYIVVENAEFNVTIEEIESPYIRIKKSNLEKMKKAINKKRSNLLKDIADTGASYDRDMESHIKMLEVQCSAELRLLYNLEKCGLDTEDFIIC